jgi:hypothetical protein
VRLAREREQVVLAQRVELDVAQQHDLVIALVEDGLQVAAGVVLEARHQLAVRPGDPVGRLEQAFAIGIFADGDKDFPHGPLDAGDVDAGVGQVGGGPGVTGVVTGAVYRHRSILTRERRIIGGGARWGTM